ncbi:uncharacterized protein A4U43_C07F24850 [Asparagus officinalis]|uniref:Uncharacterized protein n=1 Tax=Asparagus officinalis TaxID=4686 RepID=A0A5P1EEM8_ASPOF|nr:uncharacterized protein A4U43_C07F24850 [Asparagus officinalis]
MGVCRLNPSGESGVPIRILVDDFDKLISKGVWDDSNFLNWCVLIHEVWTQPYDVIPKKSFLTEATPVLQNAYLDTILPICEVIAYETKRVKTLRRSSELPRASRWGENPAEESEQIPHEEMGGYEGLYEGLYDFSRMEFQTQYAPTQLEPYREVETTEELARAMDLLEQVRGPIA